MVSALTEKQRALAEQYHHVIYAVAKKENAPITDIYDVGAIALCKATQSFKGEPANFFSYAYVAVKRAARKEILKNKQEFPVGDSCFIYGEKGFEDSEDRILAQQLLDKVDEYLTQSERQAVFYVMLGDPCRGNAASDRARAINKLRKILSGETPRINRRHSELAKAEAVALRSFGYDYGTIHRRTGIPERTARGYYSDAGKPFRGTSADVARLLNVDRSTVVRHISTCDKKIGGKWCIQNIPKIKKTAKKSSKNYSSEDIALLKSSLPDGVVAKRIQRTENAIHIKRWRLAQESGHRKADGQVMRGIKW